MYKRLEISSIRIILEIKSSKVNFIERKREKEKEKIAHIFSK